MFSAIGSTIAAWLASKGASLLLGWAAALIKDLYDQHQREQAMKNAGAQAAADSATKKSTEAADAMAQAAANHPSPADVAQRLRDGKF